MSRGQGDFEKPVGRERRQSGLLSDWWGIITSQVLPQNTPQTIPSRTQQLQNNIIAIRNHSLSTCYPKSSLRRLKEPQSPVARPSEARHPTRPLTQPTGRITTLPIERSIVLFHRPLRIRLHHPISSYLVLCHSYTMAWISETPGSGRRSASPTVFEQQREELVREIAVVSTGSHRKGNCQIPSSDTASSRCLTFELGYGASSPKHESVEPQPGKHYHSMSLESLNPECWLDWRLTLSGWQ